MPVRSRESGASASVASAYRPEIDGLRAIAVVPVILFHAGSSLFSGGFVGVDVFFVISGYLITTIILRDIRDGTFTIAGFYERRARRILPALFLVTGASTLAALCLMTPDELQDFSESVVAVALFVSNFHFMGETGYFATETELTPLLHTWSLAVEEQYYLVAPLVLFGMRRWRLRWLVLLTLALAVASLAFAEWASRELPDWNFFLTPSRVWELMVGALAAFALQGPRPLAGRAGAGLAQVLSLAGLGLILLSVVAYDEDLPFPSFYALVPTLGAALVILFARGGTVAMRLLASRLAVGIGLISYSAYLWHQPMLAFARLAGWSSANALSGVLVLTFCLAWLSWRYVETPFRKRSSISRQRVFRLAGLGSGGLIAFGLGGVLGNGLPERFREPQYSFFRSLNDLSDYRFRCRLQGLRNFDLERRCVIGDEAKAPSLVVWGDSHAEALASGLGDALRARRQSAIVFDKGGCAPLAGVMESGNRQRDRECLEQNAAAVEYIREHDINLVVMAGRWDSYAAMERFRADPLLAVDGCPTAGGFDAAMNGTVCLLRKLGVRARVLQQVPYMQQDPVEAVYDRSDGSLELSRMTFAFGRADYMGSLANRALDQLAGVTIIDPYPALCDSKSGVCRFAEGGLPLYRDIDHLSARGAALIAPLLFGDARAAR